MFTCGAFGVYLRWFRLHSARVNLSIPPVAPADVPAMYRPLIGTSTCGAKIYHIEPDTARSPRVSARRKGVKVTSRPQRYAEQMETHRRARCGGLLRLARCMETAKVFCNYGDCKRKRVGKDFSAFVHAKTAKHFGNYRDCIGLCDMVETLSVEEETETVRVAKDRRDSCAFDCIGTA